MSEFVINEYVFNQECESIAKSIIEECREADQSVDELRECCEERVHEDCDGHQWVIYTYKATQLCGNVNTNAGEEWLEGIYSKPFDGCETFSDVCTRLAFATLYCGVQSALGDLLDAIADSDGEE
jgi:hypothetical protein